MVFFLCSAVRFRSVALHNERPRKEGGQREESTEGTACGPLPERASEGDGVKQAEVSEAEKRPENEEVCLNENYRATVRTN
jgi:hypothetical protein